MTFFHTIGSELRFHKKMLIFNVPFSAARPILFKKNIKSEFYGQLNYIQLHREQLLIFNRHEIRVLYCIRWSIASFLQLVKIKIYFVTSAQKEIKNLDGICFAIPSVLFKGQACLHHKMHLPPSTSAVPQVKLLWMAWQLSVFTIIQMFRHTGFL